MSSAESSRPAVTSAPRLPTSRSRPNQRARSTRRTCDWPASVVKM